MSPLTVSPGRANGGLSDIEACGGVHREAHLKTCPDCNGDGVIEKVRTMNSNAQRAAAVLSCLMTMTMKK